MNQATLQANGASAELLDTHDTTERKTKKPRLRNAEARLQDPDDNTATSADTRYGQAHNREYMQNTASLTCGMPMADYVTRMPLPSGCMKFDLGR